MHNSGFKNPFRDVLILLTVQEEILSTCRLPVAIDILRTEILHSGRIGPAMNRLGHYFSAFQTFVVDRAEDERSLRR